MLKEKRITLDGKEYVLHEFPAMFGLKVAKRFGIVNAPDYDKPEEAGALTLEMMRFVSVVLPDGRDIALTSQTLIDNHVENGVSLGKLESEMISFNFDFFGTGETPLPEQAPVAAEVAPGNM